MQRIIAKTPPQCEKILQKEQKGNIVYSRSLKSSIRLSALMLLVDVAWFVYGALAGRHK